MKKPPEIVLFVPEGRENIGHPNDFYITNIHIK